MKVIEISIELYSELGEPTNVSPTLISLWLRDNIGQINNLAATSFTIDSTNSEISPEPSEDEKSILKQFYIVNYYNKKVQEALNSASNDSVIEITEGGATVRRLNKTEMAKTFMALRNTENDRLKELINGYKTNNATPTQVAGDDTTEGFYSSSAERKVI